jgi:hypothetical protein
MIYEGNDTHNIFQFITLFSFSPKFANAIEWWRGSGLEEGGKVSNFLIQCEEDFVLAKFANAIEWWRGRPLSRGAGCKFYFLIQSRPVNRNGERLGSVITGQFISDQRWVSIARFNLGLFWGVLTWIVSEWPIQWGNPGGLFVGRLCEFCGVDGTFEGRLKKLKVVSEDFRNYARISKKKMKSE